MCSFVIGQFSFPLRRLLFFLRNRVRRCCWWFWEISPNPSVKPPWRFVFFLCLWFSISKHGQLNPFPYQLKLSLQNLFNFRFSKAEEEHMAQLAAAAAAAGRSGWIIGDYAVGRQIGSGSFRWCGKGGIL